MWRLDIHGTPLDDADAAREELRRRAWLAISDGLRSGRDVRHHRVRVRDEAGVIVFEGTLAEAIASDPPRTAPILQHRGNPVIVASRRVRHEVEMSRAKLLTAHARLSTTIASAEAELRLAEQLVAASRRYSLRSHPLPQ